MACPRASGAVTFMYEGTPLWGRLEPARRLVEGGLDEEGLYQVRESARITYYRHIVPVASAPSEGFEDALPLFIMYVDNAARSLEALGPAAVQVAELVYGELTGFLREKGEKPASPIMRGVSVLRRAETGEGGCQDGRGLGAFYSLLFAVLVVAQVYASGLPVMRLSLAPLYALARSSIPAIGL